MTFVELLEDRIEPEPTSGCWLWLGERNTKGYPILRSRGHRRMVHRLLYEECQGSIPLGLTLDHLCRVRSCVNPRHVEPVTNEVNVLRGISWSAVNARKTTCPKGHAYDGWNTLRVSRGLGGRTFRRCCLCKRDVNTRQSRRLRDLRERLGAQP